MRKLTCILIGVVAIVFCGACTRDDATSCIREEHISTKRTVLIYMAASNTLNSFSYDDIREMEEGIVNVSNLENCNILIYLQQGVGANRTQPVLKRLIRTKDSAKQSEFIAEWEIVKKYPEQISTAPKVMGSVLSDTYSEFPADGYGLILWSHADGWLEGTPQSHTRWYGEDQFNGISYKMDIKDLNKALEKAPHLDFILFDCCLMQSAEIAYELKDKASYMLGSPAEIPGPGAPYQKLIPIFYKEKKWIELDLADAYYRYYEETYTGVSGSNYPWRGGVSMTVLDLSQVERFAQLTKKHLSVMGLVYENLKYNGVFYYDPRSNSKEYYYDLYGVMGNSTSRLSDEWINAFNDLVIYFKTTPTNYSGVAKIDFSMKGSYGLSMYVPKEDPKYDLENKYYRTLSWYNYMVDLNK